MYGDPMASQAMMTALPPMQWIAAAYDDVVVKSPHPAGLLLAGANRRLDDGLASPSIAVASTNPSAAFALSASASPVQLEEVRPGAIIAYFAH